MDRVQLSTGLRGDAVIKPAKTPGGADLVACGVVFAFKTSPSFLVVEPPTRSAANTASVLLSNVLAKTLEQACLGGEWPLYDASELLGCVLVDVQLPFRNLANRTQRCEVMATRVGDKVRRDVRVVVDFASLDLLLGDHAAAAVKRSFASMFLKVNSGRRNPARGKGAHAPLTTIDTI